MDAKGLSESFLKVMDRGPNLVIIHLKIAGFFHLREEKKRAGLQVARGAGKRAPGRHKFASGLDTSSLSSSVSSSADASRSVCCVLDKLTG